MKTLVKPFCQIYPNRQVVKNVHIQLTSSLEKGYRKASDVGRQSGGGRIIATFYDLCSEIWSGSPATEPIQAGLETVESLKHL